MPSFRSILAGAARWLAGERKQAPLGLADFANYYGAGYLPGYVDANRRQRHPTPIELVNEFRGVAGTCAHLNANAVASVPLKLYVGTDPASGRKALCPTRPLNRASALELRSRPGLALKLASASEIEEVTEHPLLDLLRAPNPYTTWSQLVYLTQVYIETVGNAYWFMAGNRLRVQELWQLPPQYVVPRSESRNPVDFYLFRGTREQRFEPREVIPFRFPSPLDPHAMGFSPLRRAIERVGLGDKELAYLQSSLDNQGRPDAIWSPSEVIGAEEARRAEHRWNQKFQRGGASRIMVSDTGGELKLLNWSPRELQGLEVVNLMRQDICNSFDVPPAMLEGVGNTWANLKASRAQHALNAVLFRVRLLEDMLNARLCSLYDPSGRLFLAFDNPVPEDDEATLNQIQTGVSTGVMTRSEGRELLHLDHQPWGDQPLISSTMVAVGPDGKPEPAENPPEAGGPGASDSRDAESPKPAAENPEKPEVAKSLARRLKRLEVVVRRRRRRPLHPPDSEEDEKHASVLMELRRARETTERVLDAKAKKPKKPQESLESIGHWLTINGAHVYIRDGQVVAGMGVRKGFVPLNRHESGEGKNKVVSYHHPDPTKHNPEHAERALSMKLPPRWRGVQIAEDPHAELQAQGKDAKGKTQSTYSAAHDAKASAEKFDRVRSMVGALKQVDARIKADVAGPEGPRREAAAALMLIRKTGFRQGSTRDTHTEHQALGATTLSADNVKIEGKKATFDFVGKHGVDIHQEIEDKDLVAMLQPRIAHGGKLFDTTDAKVRTYMKSVGGAAYHPKDLRTVIASETALHAISSMEAPKTEAEFLKARKAVGKAVAAKLGNTPDVALKSYVPPEVFHRWRAGISESPA